MNPTMIEGQKQDLIEQAIAGDKPSQAQAVDLQVLNRKGKDLVKLLAGKGVKESKMRIFVSDAMSQGLYAIVVAQAIREEKTLEEAHDYGAEALAKVRRCEHGLSLRVDLAKFVLNNGGKLETLRKDLDDILYASQCAALAMPVEIRQQLAAIQARRAQEMIDILSNPNLPQGAAEQ